MANEFPDGRPIFLQIAEMLENGIASGAYAEGAPVPSTTELAVAYTINPATALKGVTLLVDRELIYKRRGVGMFVAAGAREKILAERRQAFEKHYIEAMVQAAQELSIPKADVIKMIEGAYKMSINLYEATVLYFRKKALSGVSVEFEKGHIYGLFGENGAGKSTLLDVIAGRTFLDNGGAFVDGRTPFVSDYTLEKTALARPGEPFPFGMRVRTVFKETAAFRPDFNMERALEMAKTFDIAPDARIASLSTGRATLVRCICAMASGADHVLLDEPTLGVDAEGRKLLYREIVKDFAESGRAYIIASHHIAEMEGIADRAVILHNGEVVSAGPLDEILESVLTISGPQELVAEAAEAGEETLAVETTGAFAVATVRFAPNEETPCFPEGVTVAHTRLQEYVEAVCRQNVERGN